MDLRSPYQSVTFADFNRLRAPEAKRLETRSNPGAIASRRGLGCWDPCAGTTTSTIGTYAEQDHAS